MPPRHFLLSTVNHGRRLFCWRPRGNPRAGYVPYLVPDLLEPLHKNEYGAIRTLFASSVNVMCREPDWDVVMLRDAPSGMHPAPWPKELEYQWFDTRAVRPEIIHDTALPHLKAMGKLTGLDWLPSPLGLY